MRDIISIVMVVVLGACGKKDGPTPAPAPTPTPAPSPAPSPTAEGARVVAPDLLVWTGGDSKRETQWLRGDEVIATRAEAVVFADGKLWAIGERWSTIEQRPCGEDMEVDTKAPTTRTAVPKIVAKELGGATEIIVADPAGAEGPTYDGDIAAGVSLAGGIEAVVFFSGASSGYGCGAAHPFSESHAGAFDLAKKEEVDIPSTDALAAKLAEALLADAKKTACLEEDETVEPTAPAYIGMTFAGGQARAAWIAWRDLGHVRESCSHDVGLAAPLDETLGFGPIDPRAPKAAGARSGDGSWGMSSLSGAERDALLEVFKKEAPSFEPKPEAPAIASASAEETLATLLGKGRKRTSSKDYPGAIAAFDAAIAKDASAAAAWSGRGYAKLLAKDAGAKADLEKALALAKQDDVGFQAAVWFNLGQVAEGDKDLAAAKAAYDKANTLKPSDAAKRALERVSK